jgi:hypothetical protein
MGSCAPYTGAGGGGGGSNGGGSVPPETEEERNERERQEALKDAKDKLDAALKDAKQKAAWDAIDNSGYVFPSPPPPPPPLPSPPPPSATPICQQICRVYYEDIQSSILKDRESTYRDAIEEALDFITGSDGPDMYVAEKERKRITDKFRQDKLDNNCGNCGHWKMGTIQTHGKTERAIVGNDLVSYPGDPPTSGWAKTGAGISTGVCWDYCFAYVVNQGNAHSAEGKAAAEIIKAHGDNVLQALRDAGYPCRDTCADHCCYFPSKEWNGPWSTGYWGECQNCPGSIDYWPPRYTPAGTFDDPIMDYFDDNMP